MIPGFVVFGAGAVLFQLLIVAGFYGYLRYRYSVTDAAARKRTLLAVIGGAGLLALGQLAALGAIGSLQVVAALSFEQALTVMDAGLLVAGIGFVGVLGGFVIHVRAAG